MLQIPRQACALVGRERPAIGFEKPGGVAAQREGGERIKPAARRVGGEDVDVLVDQRHITKINHGQAPQSARPRTSRASRAIIFAPAITSSRSEEHTSEL